MHLVNWDIVKRPVIEGGLQIRDSGLANLAMGGKLLWNLLSKKKHLISQFFWKKMSQRSNSKKFTGAKYC